MKVYVLLDDYWYEGYDLNSVYSSLEKAKQAAIDILKKRGHKISKNNLWQEGYGPNLLRLYTKYHSFVIREEELL